MSFFRIHTRALGRLIADERGISLIVAVMTLLVISIMVGSVAVYTTKNLHSTYSDRSSTGSYHLAEAGLNEAIARLTAALNVPGADPTVTTTLPSTTVSYADLGGQVTYVGTAVKVAGPPEQMIWTITATGQAAAGQVRKKVLTQQVTVKGLVAGGDMGSWSRFYQDDAASCLTIDTVTMPAPMLTQGDLCLINGGSVTGAANTIDVGGNVYIDAPGTPSGPRSPTVESGWTSSANAISSNNLYATNAITADTLGATLVASGFGFTIPTTAKILGISVSVERKASVSNEVRDTSLRLQKVAGTAVGSSYANTSSYWGTSDSTPSYGDTTDLWGTTWTAAEVNATGFGVRFQARNIDNGNDNSTDTASVDWVNITVTYTGTTPATGIGTSTTSIGTATIRGSCKYNLNTAHTPCGTADHVWATNLVTAPVDPELVLPVPSFDTWFLEARPGPKHFCTNAGNNFSPLVFDNDGSANWNNSLTFDNSGIYDITPTGRDYDCQVVENGVLVGRLAWTRSTHVLIVQGAIFFDGDVRFDDDGQVVHYQGRAIIYAAGRVEFDEMVCAGGTGTASCVGSMSNWNPAQNYLVLQSNESSEYDQGGASCSGLPSNGVTCAGVHPASGFQGVVSALVVLRAFVRLKHEVVLGGVPIRHAADTARGAGAAGADHLAELDPARGVDDGAA